MSDIPLIPEELMVGREETRRPSVVSDALAARAREVCAHLLVFPSLPRDRYRDLLLDEDLREEVGRRLEAVGMQLAESFYSEHFSVRMADDTEADVRFDWATNQRMPKGAQALLVVLWAKLVLPRRAARDQRVDPDEPNIELFEQADGGKDYRVKIPREALLAEFAQRFGRSNLLRYLGQLKRLGFVKEDRGGRIMEGPLLDLMVDGQRMATEVQMGALADVLGVTPVVSPDAELDDEPLFDLTHLDDLEDDSSEDDSPEEES
ncbi:MAG: hypothetical protein ACI9WU_005476 [Myxococcota bacterium]